MKIKSLLAISVFFAGAMAGNVAVADDEFEQMFDILYGEFEQGRQKDIKKLAEPGWVFNKNDRAVSIAMGGLQYHFKEDSQVSVAGALGAPDYNPDYTALAIGLAAKPDEQLMLHGSFGFALSKPGFKVKEASLLNRRSSAIVFGASYTF